MEQSKRNLKIFSCLFIVFALTDAVTFIIDWFNGKLKIENFTGSTTEEIAKVTLIAVIIIAVVAVLVKLYLGIKGIRQAQGKTKGKANVTIAKIIFICLIILFVLAIVAVIKNTGNYYDLINYAVNMLIMYYYIKYVNAVIEK